MKLREDLGLDDLFEVQRENQDIYNGDRHNPLYIASMLLAMYEEVGELSRELSAEWKTWKKSSVIAPLFSHNVCEEAADVFIFLMNILLHYGVTPREFIETVARKQLANRERVDHARAVE